MKKDDDGELELLLEKLRWLKRQGMVRLAAEVFAAGQVCWRGRDRSDTESRGRRGLSASNDAGDELGQGSLGRERRRAGGQLGRNLVLRLRLGEHLRLDVATGAPGTREPPDGATGRAPS